MSGGGRVIPAWTRSQLGPRALAVTVVAATLGFPATAIVGCGIHEVGHGLVGTVLGYQVDRVVLCPGDAQVIWGPSPLPAVDTSLVPWTGGLLAAATLGAAYALAARARLPARSSLAWAIGLSVAAVAALQLLIGVLEGLMPGRYAEVIDANPIPFVPLLAAAGLVGAGLHVVAWRDLLR